MPPPSTSTMRLSIMRTTSSCSCTSAGSPGACVPSATPSCVSPARSARNCTRWFWRSKDVVPRALSFALARPPLARGIHDSEPRRELGPPSKNESMCMRWRAGAPSTSCRGVIRRITYTLSLSAATHRFPSPYTSVRQALLCAPVSISGMLLSGSHTVRDESCAMDITSRPCLGDRGALDPSLKPSLSRSACCTSYTARCMTLQVWKGMQPRCLRSARRYTSRVPCSVPAHTVLGCSVKQVRRCEGSEIVLSRRRVVASSRHSACGDCAHTALPPSGCSCSTGVVLSFFSSMLRDALMRSPLSVLRKVSKCGFTRPLRDSLLSARVGYTVTAPMAGQLTHRLSSPTSTGLKCRVAL
mmetsp:Transcript_26794/g.67347  ORF Transcript_26794/g.67347 Transcript_26794/m.67347 type:complete len:356 (-) Transcript_26794:1812-2879(-)